MTTEEFFRQVWPDAGVYCLATPRPAPQRGWNHHVFHSIESAAEWAATSQTDTYFAMHTLCKDRVWNKHALNKQTGDQGKWEVRSHLNMFGAKCFFADLDVGEGKNDSAATALAELKKFCTITKLPLPTVNLSGTGVHAFWPMDIILPVDKWRPYAMKLHQLMQHYNLSVDPSKIVDQSAVLRVPGTPYLKDPANPKTVKVLKAGVTSVQATLLKAIDDAVVVAGLTPRTEPVFKGQPNDDLFEANIEKDYGPPPKMRALVRACAQIKYLTESRGNVSEPVWYHGIIGVIQFVENGRDIVHKVSSGYPRYSKDETDAKLDQWPGGVSSCAKVAEKNGDSLCEGCPFAKANKNPIWAARQMDVAPKPLAAFKVGDQTITLQGIDPPHPYKRLSDGRIGYVSTNKDGDDEHKILLDHDLYPIQRMSNRVAQKEFQLWRANLPRSGPVDFELPANALYNKQELLSNLANNGVYVSPFVEDEIKKYMIAYIKRLQAEMDAEAQMSHLGWNEDRTEFILADRTICADGSVKQTSLAPSAQGVAEYLTTKGTMERQIELLKFYNSPAYIPNQFVILCALGAPIFNFTEQFGMVVHAQGDPGASKSTTLYTGASLWGDPTLFPMNGTQTGMTTLARMNRVSVLANLPVCVDEITHMETKEAQALALGVSQPGGRGGLKRNGTEKKTIGGLKSTIMISTANSSLHSVLSLSNNAGTAGSMRIFEIKFNPSNVHQKYQADHYLHELKRNYGHIGPAFMAYVIQNMESTDLRIRQLMQEIDTACHIRPAERFWCAGAATAVCTAEISYGLGLLPYRPEEIKKWIINVQIPEMRGIVRDEYITPEGVLADFLDKHHGHIIIIEKDSKLHRPPHGELVAHLDTSTGLLYISKAAFKQHCAKIGSNATQVINYLANIKAVTNKAYRMTLGRGTDHAKTQSWTFVVDMDHALISSKAEEFTAPELNIPGEKPEDPQDQKEPLLH